MSNVLEQNQYVIKEHIGFFKAANNYDILDPEDGRIIMECREEELSAWTKFFRFTNWKTATPFNIHIKTPEGRTVVKVKKGFTPFLANVVVFDENNRFIGRFKQKLFSIGGKFEVLNVHNNVVCSLKGNWTGWNFKFESQNMVLAQVKKEWAGIGKELFTDADNYMLKISRVVPGNSIVRKLILSAVMCIDMVLKERNN